MKIRLTCTQCQATFLVTDERLGQVISCPKCGRSTRMPETIAEVARRSALAPGEAARPAPAAAAAPAGVGFVPDPDDDEDQADRGGPRRRRRRLVPFVIGAVGGLAVAALVLWPMIPWPDSRPMAAAGPADPAEQTARQFLDALVGEDFQAARRLSALADPPAISSHEGCRRDPSGDQTDRGSFAPIAALHRRIGSTYTYDPAIGRFQNANPLGAAANFMDEAERLRQDPDQAEIYSRIAGGSADEQLDAAVAFAESFARLTQAALPRTELVPTYEQLVQDAEPPLPPEAESLALHYGRNREAWDALLGRPFFTIEADGPFVLERAEVVATVRDRLASPGDPARRLRMELVRFRLDAIDTGWKVVSARREADEPAESAADAEPFTSPGLEGGH